MKVLIAKGVERAVASIEEASHAVRDYIEGNGWIPNSEWSKFRRAGYVYENDALVARISYNGRAWSVDVPAREIGGAS